MLRFWEDPFNQEQLLILLRQGHSLQDCCKAMDGSLQSLSKERKLDPSFDEKIQLAMANVFTPVLKRIVAQAQFGDESDPATLKAWDIVVRHYNKALDREHRHDIIDHQYDRHTEIVHSTPGIDRPANDLVIELIGAIKEATNEDSKKELGPARNEGEVQPPEV